MIQLFSVVEHVGHQKMQFPGLNTQVLSAPVPRSTCRPGEIGRTGHSSLIYPFLLSSNHNSCYNDDTMLLEFLFYFIPRRIHAPSYGGVVFPFSRSVWGPPVWTCSRCQGRAPPWSTSEQGSPVGASSVFGGVNNELYVIVWHCNQSGFVFWSFIVGLPCFSCLMKDMEGTTVTRGGLQFWTPKTLGSGPLTPIMLHATSGSIHCTSHLGSTMAHPSYPRHPDSKGWRAAATATVRRPECRPTTSLPEGYHCWVTRDTCFI